MKFLMSEAPLKDQREKERERERPRARTRERERDERARERGRAPDIDAPARRNKFLSRQTKTPVRKRSQIEHIEWREREAQRGGAGGHSLCQWGTREKLPPPHTHGQKFETVPRRARI